MKIDQTGALTKAAWGAWTILGTELIIDVLNSEVTNTLGIATGVVTLWAVAERIAARVEGACNRVAQAVETTGHLQCETMQATAKQHAEDLGSSLLSPANLLTTGFRGAALAAYDVASAREAARCEARDGMDTGPFNAVRRTG